MFFGFKEIEGMSGWAFVLVLILFLLGFFALPVLLFVLGLPCFGLALADPHTGFAREEVSYPGRRIALLVDGSSSMVMKFETKKLKTPENRSFCTLPVMTTSSSSLRPPSTSRRAPSLKPAWSISS